MAADLASKIAGVDGWLEPVEAQALFDLARRCTGAGVIVEIGSWKGKSTICLAAGARAGNRPKIYAVDPHTGSPEHHAEFGEVETFAEFTANVAAAGYESDVVPLRMRSTEAAAHVTEPVELLFIDGDHSYEAVVADVEAWWPKLTDGGFVAVHDAFLHLGAPRQVIRERIVRNCSDVRFAYSLFYARKRARPSVAQRLAAQLTLLQKDLRERRRRISA